MGYSSHFNAKTPFYIFSLLLLVACGGGGGGSSSNGGGSSSNGGGSSSSGGSVLFNKARGPSGFLWRVVPAADGSGDVYLGGDFTTYNNTAAGRIVRLNSDGSVNSTFVTGTGFNSPVYSIAPTTDGSGDVYVGGGFSQYNGTAANRIIRLNSDGSIDSAFSFGSGFNSRVNSIAPATDGSGDVYVGGYFASYNGTAANRIIRLNNDGSVDTAFSIGTGFSNPVDSIVPATDGSGDVYVSGDFTGYNGTATNRIIRLNSDGSVDSAFSFGNGFNDTVTNIAPATDGSGDVYVGGFFTNYNGTAANYIVRLNSDGSVDTAFSFGSGFDNGIGSIAPATDGSGDVYVGGWFIQYNGTGANRIIRLNSDGSIDSALSIGSGFNGGVDSIAPATDGSGDVFIGGEFTGYNGTAANAIIRLNSDGSVDTALSIGTGFNIDVLSIAPATDGSGDVYVGGDFTDYNGTAANSIIRLNSDGSVDLAFIVGTGFNSPVLSIAPATDGSGDVYVGGFFTDYNGTAANSIIRLNSDGSVDTAFSFGTGFNSDVNSIAPATDGSGDVYVGGDFTDYNGTVANRIIRLNSDGSVDPALSIGTGFNNSVDSIAPATDGSGDVYVGGLFTNYKSTAANRIIRLNSDGSVDTALSIGTGFNNDVLSIAPATDGSGDVYVGGDFTDYNGTVANRIIRLNSDGSVDTALSIGTGFNNDVLSIAPAIDGSGDVYVGGDFTDYNGTAANSIVRLNSDGSIDTALSIGTGFNDTVLSIAPATDGSG